MFDMTRSLQHSSVWVAIYEYFTPSRGLAICVDPFVTCYALGVILCTGRDLDLVYISPPTRRRR